MVALFTRAWIEISTAISVLKTSLVALFTRAWIEILHGFYEQEAASVALFTRAWIEIPTHLSRVGSCVSPSSRGRGLKYKIITQFSQRYVVALFTRAWIEIIHHPPDTISCIVALFTRAWIEITVIS